MSPAERRLKARQRLCRIHMRRAGLFGLTGYTPPAGEGVDRIWRLHGWTPPTHAIVYVPTEVRRAA